MPDPQPGDIGPFVESLKMVPKSGLHNAYKNPERQVACFGCWDTYHDMIPRTPTHLGDLQSHMADRSCKAHVRYVASLTLQLLIL